MIFVGNRQPVICGDSKRAVHRLFPAARTTGSCPIELSPPSNGHYTDITNTASYLPLVRDRLPFSLRDSLKR